MHHHSQLVAFKINSVISKSKTMECPATSLKLTEAIQISIQNLVWQTSKFAQDEQLQFLRHSRQLGRANGVKNNLKGSHE